MVGVTPGLDWIPRHRCGLVIEHNWWRTDDRTIEEVVAEEDDQGDWVSDEERNRALLTGEIWELCWHPYSPMERFRLVASSLGAIRAELLAYPEKYK